MTLYHYTCRHAMLVIGTGPGLLLPAWTIYDEHQRSIAGDDVRAIAEYVWLTDLETPIAEALGLVKGALRCDRTGYRYRVTDEAAPIARYVTMRRSLPPTVRTSLEEAPGAMPMHWWVSHEPVAAVFDPIAVAA